MVTAAKAAITQMSSVATPRLTGVNRSSAVFVAMLGDDAIRSSCLSAQMTSSKRFEGCGSRQTASANVCSVATGEHKIDERSQTKQPG